jgi:hypothetical protein
VLQLSWQEKKIVRKVTATNQTVHSITLNMAWSQINEDIHSMVGRVGLLDLQLSKKRAASQLITMRISMGLNRLHAGKVMVE